MQRHPSWSDPQLLNEALGADLQLIGAFIAFSTEETMTNRSRGTPGLEGAHSETHGLS
jgi:hypothetical protein